LPEGTDNIIDGASDLGGGSGSGSAIGGPNDFGSGSTFAGAEPPFGDSLPASGGAMAQTQSLKTQATEKARDVASQGKEKASEALDSVSRMVSETADTVDERLGPQYGNYVRKAADALDGFNDSIRGKQVDELFDDARNLVRKSPAVAIGAAAAIGFLLVRLVRSGMPQTVDQDDDGETYGRRSAGLTGLPPRVNNDYDPIA